MTNLSTVTQSEAAGLLDPDDLPVGTYVKFITGNGFSGTERERGRIEAVTSKSYRVVTMWGESRMIGRDLARRATRGFQALLTAEEYERAILENKAEIDRTNDEAQVQRAARDEQDRQARARRAAERAFAEANPFLFEAYLDAALEETT